MFEFAFVFRQIGPLQKLVFGEFKIPNAFNLLVGKIPSAAVNFIRRHLQGFVRYNELF